MTIQERAVLVSLKISQWSARKYDKKVTQEVHANHGASADAGRYSKHLLPGDAPSYKALIQHLGTTRTEHYAQTLAWSDEGLRLLPITNQDRYRVMILSAKSMMADLLSTFLADYPQYRESARSRLNGMFNPSDYPSVGDLEAKFSISAEYTPVPSAEDFRVHLSDDIQSEIETELTSRVERATQGAMSDAWSRLYDCVNHLQERLAQPGAIFRDSLVTNVREVCDVLSRLNVTGSIELEQMRAAVEENLSRYDPDTLRENDALRSNVAQTAEQILGSIRGTRRIQMVNPEREEATIGG